MTPRARIAPTSAIEWETAPASSEPPLLYFLTFVPTLDCPSCSTQTDRYQRNFAVVNNKVSHFRQTCQWSCPFSFPLALSVRTTMFVDKDRNLQTVNDEPSRSVRLRTMPTPTLEPVVKSGIILQYMVQFQVHVVTKHSIVKTGRVNNPRQNDISKLSHSPPTTPTHALPLVRDPSTTRLPTQPPPLCRHHPRTELPPPPHPPTAPRYTPISSLRNVHAPSLLSSPTQHTHEVPTHT